MIAGIISVTFKLPVGYSYIITGLSIVGFVLLYLRVKHEKNVKYQEETQRFREIHQKEEERILENEKNEVLSLLKETKHSLESQVVTHIKIPQVRLKPVSNIFIFNFCDMLERELSRKRMEYFVICFIKDSSEVCSMIEIKERMNWINLVKESIFWYISSIKKTTGYDIYQIATFHNHPSSDILKSNFQPIMSDFVTAYQIYLLCKRVNIWYWCDYIISGNNSEEIFWSKLRRLNIDIEKEV
jgi:hypothetical protein